MMNYETQSRGGIDSMPFETALAMVRARRVTASWKRYRPVLHWSTASALLFALNGVVEAQTARPAVDTASAAATNVRCPAATFTNEKPELREAFRTAFVDACAILESDQFRATVESLQLARKCPTLPFKKHKLLPGAEIYRRLVEGMPGAVSVSAEKVGWASTVAVTNAAERSITIRPERFSEWTGSDRSLRAGMVNTLVHEMTHLIEPTPGAGFSYFQDGGQWTPWCHQNLLVSYEIGDRAEDQWMAAHP